jgi:hypothetical protein
VTQLEKIESSWFPDFHMENGFDRESNCRGAYKSPSAPATDLDSRSKSNSPSLETECCGQNINRHMFNPERLQCCEDGTTKTIGSCEDF